MKILCHGKNIIRGWALESGRTVKGRTLSRDTMSNFLPLRTRRFHGFEPAVGDDAGFLEHEFKRMTIAAVKHAQTDGSRGSLRLPEHVQAVEEDG